MPKQKIEIEVDVPEGWKIVRYEKPEVGEHFISLPGTVAKWRAPNNCRNAYPIVERVEQWRPATVDDVIRSLQGEKVAARFYNAPYDLIYGTLCGFSETAKHKWINEASRYQFCEVLVNPENK
jgi:hypothetical protein